MSELFIEIGMEEIPAGYLEPAYLFMGDELMQFFKKNRIEFGDCQMMGTPRRLITSLSKVQELQEDIIETHYGPSIKSAYDSDGRPTKAAMGFARGKGIEVSALTRRDSQKGEVVCAHIEKKGRPTRDLLNEFLPQLIGSIPSPKKMRWGAKHIAFARPVQWIVCLFGGVPLEFEWNGLDCQNLSRGHRFLSPGTFPCSGLEDFLKQSRSYFVVADPKIRKRVIWEQTLNLAKSVGGTVEEDSDLLDEVSCLVEFPQPILCGFESRFLELPRELLIITMKHHQRYFPVIKEDGSLASSFIAVSNMPADGGKAIQRGNERVLRARLEDARFFYEEDRKKKLEDFVEPLRDVVFQNDLGSMYDKVQRVCHLALKVAENVCPDRKETVKRAADLCKADLITQMVFEFPELQGVAGGYYALHSGETAETAQAIKEHYQPAFAGDALPSTSAGSAVAIGDKLDTILGCISVGLIPSGSEDPYALRRHALGIIQIILKGNWNISLDEWIDSGIGLLRETKKIKSEGIRRHVLDLFTQRFKTLLVGQGFPYDVIDAVLSVGIDSFVDVEKKIWAFSELKAQPYFEPLAVTFRRVVSILTKEAEGEIDCDLFKDPGEKQLYDSFLRIQPPVEKFLEKKNFTAALAKIVEIKSPVDQFFDSVLVMDTDQDIRINRLRLLYNISLLFSRIADFSKIVVKKS